MDTNAYSSLYKIADLHDEKDIDFQAIQQAIVQILNAINEDPDRQGLKKTPNVLPECMRSYWQATVLILKS